MKKNHAKVAVVIAFVAMLGAALVEGCRSSENPSAESARPAMQPAAFALFGPPPRKSGVELWSENCMRCHNGRPPDEFSGAQWNTIVHHMRLRANLTGEQAREIVKFLQSSSGT